MYRGRDRGRNVVIFEIEEHAGTGGDRSRTTLGPSAV